MPRPGIRLRALKEHLDELTKKVIELVTIASLLFEKGIITKDEVEAAFTKLHRSETSTPTSGIQSKTTGTDAGNS